MFYWSIFYTKKGILKLFFCFKKKKDLSLSSHSNLSEYCFSHANHAPVTVLQLLLLEKMDTANTHCCQVTSNTQHAHVVHTVNRQKHKSSCWEV